jgi:glucose-6-phosphate 1-dehydrogenase
MPNDEMPSDRADPVRALDGTLTSDPSTLARAEPAPPSVLVIFGAGGDLTKRLLMPALYNLSAAKLLHEDFFVLGVDRVPGGDESFREQQSQTIASFLRARGSHAADVDDAAWAWLRDRLRYLAGDLTDSACYDEIGRRLEAHQHSTGHSNCVFYMAVADRFFAPIIDHLAEAKLLEQSEHAFRRVVIEKPFGHDLATARALDARVLSVMGEDQIFRIDHFLGKETVQNIMALRFSNGIFEPLWQREHIDHVQITALETVGVESRAKFYEGTGALRDMVPNHMFQLLAMTAMEAPNSFDADAVRAEKAKVIEAIHPMSGSRATECVVRGQYGAGTLHGDAVPGYRHEPGVAPDSHTETYIAMKLGIDNWRWAGVPFYIRTGKRMHTRKTEISIHFKQAPFCLFRDTPVEALTPNVLTLHIQPSEGASLQFSAKVPGPKVHLGGVTMEFRYADYFKAANSTGYETLLYDVLIGDPTLFQRADNVEAGWAVVQPILEAWEDGRDEVHRYAAGSAGPAQADRLLAHDGRSWVKLS